MGRCEARDCYVGGGCGAERLETPIYCGGGAVGVDKEDAERRVGVPVMEGRVDIVG